MAGRFQSNTEEPASDHSPASQLAHLPPAPPAAPARGAIHDDEYYDDGLDELPPPSSGGRTGWVRMLGVLVLISVMFIAGALSQRNSTKPLPVGPITESAGAAAGSLVVHVTGRVKTPGVYQLPFEARVNDAIQKAGGALPDADLNAINLAAWAEDGSRIEVPAKAMAPQIAQSPVTVSEALSEPARSTPDTKTVVRAPAVTVSPPKQTAAAPRREKAVKKDNVPRAVTASGAESANASPEFLEKNPIDLNTATSEQLQVLPGIGPATAEKILAYRKEKGRFSAVDDLDSVPGIGPKTLEKLRPLVTAK